MFEKLSGRMVDIINVLKEASPLSLQELAQALREGKDALVAQFRQPASQAEKLTSADTGFVMQIEELTLPATPTIRLNVAREGATPILSDTHSSGADPLIMMVIRVS